MNTLYFYVCQYCRLPGLINLLILASQYWFLRRESLSDGQHQLIRWSQWFKVYNCTTVQLTWMMWRGKHKELDSCMSYCRPTHVTQSKIVMSIVVYQCNFGSYKVIWLLLIFKYIPNQLLWEAMGELTVLADGKSIYKYILRNNIADLCLSLALLLYLDNYIIDCHWI